MNLAIRPNMEQKIKGGKMKDQRNYQELKVVEKVLVKVPKGGAYMEEIPEHKFELHGGTINVPRHWRNGFVVVVSAGSKIILNRHFYGIKDRDLGRKIVATVKVIKKTTQDGREFVMLDIINAPDGTKPIYELKFFTNGQGNVPIPGATTKITFQSLQSL